MEPAPFDVDQVLARLTVGEKARLTAGRDMWRTQPLERHGVPALAVSDGPHGVRKASDTGDLSLTAEPATCFPTASALAATWDAALLEQVGVALGEEARAAGVGVLLGPGVNLKRTPLCGRNFEYFSEDPLLATTLATAWIRGVQSTGVGASLKHFAANNTEHRRFGIDTFVDERALRELYLACFERAVRDARPATVMAAYNRLEGLHCTESPMLLTEVLRREWGFPGLVVSDWGATFDRVPAVAAGCDLQMPGFAGRGDAELVEAVEQGRLPGAALDASARRVLELVAARARPAGPAYDVGAHDEMAHHELARRAAAEGTVLLRNEGGLLPLRPDADVAVVGAFAAEPRYQGAGSSQITPHRVDDALSRLTELLGEGSLTYAAGYRRHDEAADELLLSQAREAARDRDAVVVFVGLPESAESEGLDRTHLRLPSAHDALVEAVAEVNPNVVVVLSNGAPVEMPWAGRVSAVVEAYLGGQAGGSAVAEVLLGVREPGGRLAETFPARWSDLPVSRIPLGPRQVEYRESLYVGYRWFDSAGVDPLFPFGHGLSYATFDWSGFSVTPERADDGDGLRVEVSLSVTNTGQRAGTDVVQVYVHDEESTVFRPEQELRAFAKVRLQPGESREVRLSLDRRAFAYWDVAEHGWRVEPGRFEIRVGASSRDMRHRAAVEIRGTFRPAPRPEPEAYRRPDGAFPRTAFAELHGGLLPDNVVERRGAYTLDTLLADMRGSPLARLLLAALQAGARRALDMRDNPAAARMVQATLRETNLRMLPLLTRGIVSAPVVRGLLELVNGRYVRGLGPTLAGIARRR